MGIALFNPAKFEGIVDSFKNSRIAIGYRFVHRVFKTDTNISISRPVEAREHFKLYVVTTANFSYDIRLDCIKQSGKYRPNNSSQR